MQSCRKGTKIGSGEGEEEDDEMTGDHEGELIRTWVSLLFTMTQYTG